MAEDRNDYFAAFAIGAIVGIGATLLLAPKKPTGAKRLLQLGKSSWFGHRPVPRLCACVLVCKIASRTRASDGRF